MLVVLAHPRDFAARAMADRSPQSVCLMTPRDLSQPGWRHHVGATGEEWCVVSGRPIRTATLQGVITRIPCVSPADLTHITGEDREYVAAEMTAFLASWLTRLRCPVLNRPDATSLMGPNRGRERWLLLAARAGLHPVERRCTAPGHAATLATATVAVIGRQWIGAVAPELGAQAVRLAEQAGVDLLTVQFDSAAAAGAFVCAELAVDIGSDAIASALLERIGVEAVA